MKIQKILVVLLFKDMNDNRTNIIISTILNELITSLAGILILFPESGMIVEF